LIKISENVGSFHLPETGGPRSFNKKQASH